MPSNTGENSKMSKEGCCICGIRRSSEGFTSSERFSKSGQLKKCFRLSKSRYGVLCSDCLTVFKKWQRMNHVARQSKDLSSVSIGLDQAFSGPCSWQAHTKFVDIKTMHRSMHVPGNRHMNFFDFPFFSSQCH